MQNIEFYIEDKLESFETRRPSVVSQTQKVQYHGFPYRRNKYNNFMSMRKEKEVNFF